MALSEEDEKKLAACQLWLDHPSSSDRNIAKKVNRFSEVAWCKWAIAVIKRLANEGGDNANHSDRHGPE